MVVSIWKSTLAVTVTCAGLSLAQTPAGYKSDKDSVNSKALPKFVTIAERGRSAQRCQLLSSWKTADGATAYKVKAVDTGEMMTVVESAPSSPGTQMGKTAIAMRIFRWGKDNKPPHGAPLEPSLTASAKPLSEKSQKRTTAASTKSAPVPPSRQVALVNQAPAWPTGSSKSPAAPPPESFPLPMKPAAQRNAALERQMTEFPLINKEPKPASENHANMSSAPSAGAYLAKQASELPLAVSSAPMSPPAARDLPPYSVPNANGNITSESLPVPVVTIPDPQPQIIMEAPRPNLSQARKTVSPREAMDSARKELPAFDANLPNAFSAAAPKQTSRSDNNAFARPMPEANGQAMMMNTGIPVAMGYPAGYGNGMDPSVRNSMMTAQGYYQRGDEMMTPPQMASGPGQPVQQMGYTLPLPPAAEYWLNVLHVSVYPSQREWAADVLTSFDWKVFPAIIDSMVAAARQDSAATVRVACIRCLARMHMNRADVLTTLTALKTDADPRVQQEAEEAFLTLAPAGSK